MLKINSQTFTFLFLDPSLIFTIQNERFRWTIQYRIEPKSNRNVQFKLSDFNF